MTYQIGDIVSFDYLRRPLEGYIEPEWYILTTPPQREIGAEAYLRRIGVTDVWFPTETRYRPNPRGGRKIKYDSKIAPGYIFAMFERRPVWDVLFRMGRGRVSGAVSHNEWPLRITEDALAAMRQTPLRVEEKRQKAERERLEAMLANQPKPGERAELTEGTLSGYLVDVTEVRGTIVHYLIRGENMNIPGQAQINSVKRLE